MATKKTTRNEVLSWAESRVREMKKAQAKNKKDNTIVTVIMAFINLAIIAMAATALAILMRHMNDTMQQDILDANGNVIGQATVPAVDTKGLVMASIAAGLTILIFFVNVTNIIYRSVMRWQTYKNAADAIQHEIARFHLHDEYRRYKNPDQKFIDKIKDIEETANHTKRKKNVFKIVLKALSGGDNV